MHFGLNTPGSFLTHLHAELDTRYTLGGIYMATDEVFASRGFLPLVMFYSVSRLINQFQIDISSKLQLMDDEAGLFKRSVFIEPCLLEQVPVLKYVLTQLSVDLLQNGERLAPRQEIELDNLYDYFNALPEEREQKQWKPRHL